MGPHRQTCNEVVFLCIPRKSTPWKTGITKFALIKTKKFQYLVWDHRGKHVMRSYFNLYHTNHPLGKRGHKILFDYTKILNSRLRPHRLTCDEVVFPSMWHKSPPRKTRTTKLALITKVLLRLLWLLYILHFGVFWGLLCLDKNDTKDTTIFHSVPPCARVYWKEILQSQF